MEPIKDKIIKSELVDWKRFEFIQSENFKELKKPAYEKLKQSIIKNSFVESFKVWQNGKQLYCLDGYHRCLILKELEADGFDVPEKFRADFIDCKDKKEAAKLVAIYSSIYAKITKDGLYEFIHTTDVGIETLKLESDIPGIDMNAFELGYFGEIPLPEGEQAEPEIFDGSVFIVKVPTDLIDTLQPIIEKMGEDYGVEINIS